MEITMNVLINNERVKMTIKEFLVIYSRRYNETKTK